MIKDEVEELKRKLKMADAGIARLENRIIAFAQENPDDLEIDTLKNDIHIMTRQILQSIRRKK